MSSSTPPAPAAARVLVLGALLGLLVGALLTNLSTVLLEHDESGTLGAACEHAEATVVGAPGGLLVGLAAAAMFLVLRRHGRSVVLAVLGALVGAVVALVVVDLLLYPLATSHLPIFICSY